MNKSVLFTRKHTHVPLCHSIDNTMSGGKSRTRDSRRLYSLRQRNATTITDMTANVRHIQIECSGSYQDRL